MFRRHQNRKCQSTNCHDSFTGKKIVLQKTSKKNRLVHSANKIASFFSLVSLLFLLTSQLKISGTL